LATENRLAEIAARIDESIEDREKEVAGLKIRIETAISEGRLLPPERDNALDAVRKIERLDTSDVYVRETIARLKDILRNRGDSKISAQDWKGAQTDFKSILQYFPEDIYSRTQLSLVEDKVAEMERSDRQRDQSEFEKEQLRKRLSILRRSALSLFHKGSYQESIAEWTEILDLVQNIPNSPNADEAYFYLGASCQEDNQMDSAIFNYEKCLAHNPDHALAHLNLGMLYDYHRKNFPVAEEHLRKAMELGGTTGYEPDRIQAMIQDLEDRFQAETALNTLFPAEHLHMFSNCRGNLRFTEEGVEYITTETDHSFYERFQELRLLALKGKDLTIKTRHKTFNLRFLSTDDAERVKTWCVMTSVCSQ
jgi:tetratricopeptide (TPR) repeat protein